MRVIFLAAGKGERIFKQIKINKPLIQIGNRSVLENLVLGVKEKKIKKISIITGFKRKNISDKLGNIKNLEFIYNKHYKNKDMLHSLIVGLMKYNENILFSYSDIIYENSIFKSIKDYKSKYILIPYLKDWRKVWKIRKKSIYKDAETFSFDRKNILKDIGKKIYEKKRVQGQFMGIIYIPKRIRNNILNLYKKVFNKKKVQTTQFLNSLIKMNFKIKCMKYQGEWYEIDDYKDYKLFLETHDFKRIKKYFKI